MKSEPSNLEHNEEPVWREKRGWTCPEGYMRPKCPGCGHNYFDYKPVKLKGNLSAYGPKCHWCIEEEKENE